MKLAPVARLEWSYRHGRQSREGETNGRCAEVRTILKTDRPRIQFVTSLLHVQRYNRSSCFIGVIVGESELQSMKSTELRGKHNKQVHCWTSFSRRVYKLAQSKGIKRYRKQMYNEECNVLKVEQTDIRGHGFATLSNQLQVSKKCPVHDK
ncbi:hypothetical protein KIN20_007283 [Parelaphostrongylus tenuis]|uniref:Uncharacterized protein n=1 Tax=Parelaphostrongylus tenuis TaxID=148309 RepID=A0AAD5QHQ2_PARTN|nr:hypothetical protein KIN20_007283 [Parelaphostrongylus tenuis]